MIPCNCAHRATATAARDSPHVSDHACSGVAAGSPCLLWVKLRRSQNENMFSALPPNSDIARWQLAFGIRASYRLMRSIKYHPYLRTSAGGPSHEGGTLPPMAFAVVRLITSSNFTGSSMGKAAGF